jgi:uncharacterized membrane protein YjjB (DUF3815 family)
MLIQLIITFLVAYLVYTATKYTRSQWVWTILAGVAAYLLAPIVLNQFIGSMPETTPDIAV